MDDQATRFNELDPAVQKMLADMRGDDVETLKDCMELAKATRTVSRFVKWLIITIVGVFMGTVMFYESLLKVIGWIKGVP
jgi:hypothetical protein